MLGHLSHALISHWEGSIQAADVRDEQPGTCHAEKDLLEQAAPGSGCKGDLEKGFQQGGKSTERWQAVRGRCAALQLCCAGDSRRLAVT